MRLQPSTALLAVLVLLAGVWFTGCDPVDNSGFTSELNDPNYVRGGQLMRTGRNQEALSAFLKVVDKRGGDAPESHLQAGILYLQSIKDPIAAIYHLNRYLELKPNSPQAEIARQLIDTGKKEFAKMLPAEPFEGQLRRRALMENVEKLQKENFDLKEEIARLRGLPPSQRPQPAAPAPSAAVEETAQEEEPAPSVVPVPQPARNPVVTPTRPTQTQANPTVANAPTQPASASGRVHTVEAKETLYGISVKYYGTGRRVNDIVAANPGVLQSSSTPLKYGMKLRIP